MVTSSDGLPGDGSGGITGAGGALAGGVIRAMAVDVGKVRVGLALSDPTGTLASPLATVRMARDPAATAAEIAELARSRGVTHIIVGLPLTLSGKESFAAVEARAMANAIARASGIEPEMVDERMTTAKTQRMLIDADVSRKKRREVVDKLAACEILDTWLIRRRAGHEGVS